MTACNTFPKSSGDCAYESEYNTMYAGALAGCGAVSASLENAMNITRLQYQLSLTDISHDYMVVDSMTAAAGFENTICTCNTSTTSTWVCPASCALNGYYCGCNKYIVTNSVTYSSAAKSVYLDYVKLGAGTVVYHVINTATGCCLCCNLVPNTLYQMTCCIACHIYKIFQCADAVSCIKSYAVAVAKV